ncbi:MAG: RNA polymerase sigma factor [Bacteroidota bacterium]
MEQQKAVLQKALKGDIHAFQSLFSEFQEALRSYLYRLLANRSDAEDISHDTFIKAYDKLHQFRGESSLKTWVFQIATSLAYNYLKRRNNWTEDVSAQAKEIVRQTPALARRIQQVSESATFNTYDIKEHIDTCFTCISKTLPIENQICLMLKDVYDFSIKEIMLILDKSEGTVKYLLQTARKTMAEVFDKRCALVNKNGICHQCSELNGWLNPKQDQQEARMKIKMVKEAGQHDKEMLFSMRTQLIKYINPLSSSGHELQEVLMECNRIAMGESKTTS